MLYIDFNHTTHIRFRSIVEARLGAAESADSGNQDSRNPLIQETGNRGFGSQGFKKLKNADSKTEAVDSGNQHSGNQLIQEWISRHASAGVSTARISKAVKVKVMEVRCTSATSSRTFDRMMLLESARLLTSNAKNKHSTCTSAQDCSSRVSDHMHISSTALQKVLEPVDSGTADSGTWKARIRKPLTRETETRGFGNP